jgi:uncharacterized protein YukE
MASEEAKALERIAKALEHILAEMRAARRERQTGR